MKRFLFNSQFKILDEHLTHLKEVDMPILGTGECGLKPATDICAGHKNKAVGDVCNVKMLMFNITNIKYFVENAQLQNAFFHTG